MNKKFTKLIAALALLVFMMPSLAGWGQTRDSYSYTFESKIFVSNPQTATLNQIDWTFNGTGGEYYGYDATKGQQFGSGSKPFSACTLSTSGIEGTITNVTVNTSGAASINATLSITVGGTSFQYNNSNTYTLTSSATSVSFTGSAYGDIVLSYSNSSSKAIYIKSITVTYTTGSGTTTYTVTYDGNGSDSGTVPVDNNEYEEGEEVTVLGPGTMAKTGHTFEWWEDAEGTPYEKDDTFEIYENTTLTAQWSVNTYDYTLSVTGADNNAMAQLYVDNAAVLTGAKIAYGKEVTVAVTVSEGYTYTIGVKDASNNDVLVSNDKFTMPASNVTVTVTTAAIPTYTITFDAGTGTAVSPMNGLEGSSITLPTTTPSQTCASRGWTFAGWAAASVSETTTAPTLLSGEYPVTGNATLYAVYKVTEGNGGTETFNFETIATDNHWENATVYNPVTIGAVTLTGDQGTSSTACPAYYSSDDSWRMYKGSSLTVSSSGSDVTAVTSSPNKTFTINNGTATISFTETVKFTEISVTYGTTTTTYNSNPDCLEQVATPTFTPAEGTYTGAQNVEISCTTDGATILYKTAVEGGWQTYSTAIPVSTTTTIWAKATKNGMDDSEVAEATYTIQYILTAAMTNIAEYFVFVGDNEIELDENNQAPVNAGATVYFSLTAEDCYTVSSLTVNGSTTGVTEEQPGVYYSFVMPEGNTTVGVSTTPLTQYTLTVVGGENVTFDMLAGTGSTSVPITNGTASICEQSFVSIANLTANSGRVLESVTFTVGGNTTTLTLEEGVYHFTMPSSDATLTFTTAETITYSLVTNINQLVSGRHYIIASKGVAGSAYAMGQQKYKTNGTTQTNRNGVGVTVSSSNNHVYITEQEGVYEFVINGPEMITKNNDTIAVYTIYDAQFPGYLYAGSSSDNYLNTQSFNNANGQWTIEIANTGSATVKAQGSNTRNWMRSNGNLFACYASGQSDIFIYMKDNDTNYDFYKDITAHTDATGAGNTDGWYFIASPINSDYTPAGSMIANNTHDLYRLSGNTWENFKNTDHADFTTLQNGQGYLYANSVNTTLHFSGAINTFTTENNANVKNLSEGWNLIGNPYNIPIYINKSYYKMNAAGTAVETADGITSVAIPVCTGVVINAGENEAVTFSTSVPSNSTGNQGNIQMTLSQQATNRGTSTTIDNAFVSFNEGNKLEKFYFMQQNANLYIPQGTEEYAIVSSEAQGTMPVNFRANENGQYTLTVNPENVEMNYLHLIDNMTGADIDLLQTPSYSFNATTNDYESRFKLVFASSICEDANGDNETFAFYSNGNWVINNAGNATLQVVDLMGRILSSETVNGSVSKTINATPGVYMLRLINGENVKVQKVVIE